MITHISIVAICPVGYQAIAQDIDGVGKKWAQPHPDPQRSIQQCADICNDRRGCTSFEYHNGPTEHGACGTYTGGNRNIKGDRNRDQAGSKWYSCVKAPALHGQGSSNMIHTGVG